MPSPLEKIEEGLKTKNWQLVSDGYFELTDKRINVSINDTLAREIEYRPPYTQDTTSPYVQQAPIYKTPARTADRPVKKQINMFADDRTEGYEHK